MNNNVFISTAPLFRKNFKRLAKHYASFRDDYAYLLQELRDNPQLGKSLGNKLRKVRMKISSKGKGKSGGARIITYTCNLRSDGVLEIMLLDIYDKSERSTMTDKELKELLDISGL